MGAIGSEYLNNYNLNVNGLPPAKTRPTGEEPVNFDPSLIQGQNNFFTSGKVDVAEAIRGVDTRGGNQDVGHYYQGKDDIKAFSNKWGESQNNGLTLDVGARYVEGGVVGGKLRSIA